MTREPLDYVVSMLLGPIVCATVTLVVRQEIESAAASIGAENLDQAQYDLMMSATSLALLGAAIVLVASILLPVAFAVALRIASRHRNTLAAGFTALARTYIVLAAVVLLAQACVIFASVYEITEFIGYVRRPILLVIALGAGMAISAIAILFDLPRMKAVDSMHVTALPLEVPGRHWLHRRIAHIAGRVGIRPPTHVIASLSPQLLATAMQIRMRDIGELNGATTLCLSSAHLRNLTEEELDVAIAHALGELKGEDPRVSQYLVPSYNSVCRVVSGRQEQDAPLLFQWLRYARIPANGFLAAMLSAMRAAMRRVDAQRAEGAAQARKTVATAGVSASYLAKATVLDRRWEAFRHSYELYMLRGQSRRNLPVDFAAHLAAFAKDASPDARRALLESRLPHPFDANGTLQERTHAEGVDGSKVLDAALIDLGAARPVEGELTALEERLTAIENDYFRIPGRRVAPNVDEALPLELA